MPLHAAVDSAPVVARRPIALGVTGIQGRRVARRDTLRHQLREVLLHPTGRHRTTFIPVDSYSLHAD